MDTNCTQGWLNAAPSQWETSLQSNAVSHWLGANLESAVGIHIFFKSYPHYWLSRRHATAQLFNIPIQVYRRLVPVLPSINGTTKLQAIAQQMGF